LLDQRPRRQRLARRSRFRLQIQDGLQCESLSVTQVPDRVDPDREQCARKRVATPVRRGGGNEPTEVLSRRASVNLP
jgi:hypothetical protein